MIYVAKSYKDLPVVGETFKENGREYCNVKTTSGSLKKVRVYTEKEYLRMYPDTHKWKPQREMLGFQKGYITLLMSRGGEEDERFLEKSNARFHKIMGWYIVSTEEVPQLPATISQYKIGWKDVGKTNGELVDDVLLHDIINDIYHNMCD